MLYEYNNLEILEKRFALKADFTQKISNNRNIVLQKKIFQQLRQHKIFKMQNLRLQIIEGSTNGRT